MTDSALFVASCRGRMVRPSGQTRGVLHQAIGRLWSMPHRTHRGGTCLRLDLLLDLCVFTMDIFLSGAMTQKAAHVHVSAYCAAVCADHGAKKRRPPPLPIHVSKPTISSPVIVEARDVDSKFISFANVPLGPNRGPSGLREMYA